VRDPEQYRAGKGKPIRIEEKPESPKSAWLRLRGDPPRGLKSSPRGRLEITDVHNRHLSAALDVEKLGRGASDEPWRWLCNGFGCLAAAARSRASECGASAC
jgi:dTDP-glucose pyrophosphorylase